VSSLKLETVYKLAYGDQKPFETSKSLGPFLNALLTVYINKEIYGYKEGSFFVEGPLDIFLRMYIEYGMDLETLFKGINSYYLTNKTDIDIDDFLSSYFCESPLFSECESVKLLKTMDERSLKRAGLNKPINVNFSPEFIFFALSNARAATNFIVETNSIYRKMELRNFFVLVSDVFMHSDKYGVNTVKEACDVIQKKSHTHSEPGSYYVKIFKKAMDTFLESNSFKNLTDFSKKAKSSSLVNEVVKVDDLIDENFSINEKGNEVVIENTSFDSMNSLCDLNSYIIGQDEAVEKIVDRLLSSLVGFNDTNKPISSFLLTGPTGVGKTETAKTVAKLWCDGKMHTLDMTTFSNKEDISRLVGASAGYVGYDDKISFVEYVDQNPKCVLLFDEIDKCHRDCLDILMRMLDEGELITAKGKKISLKDTIVFCTTNLTEYLKDNKNSKTINQLITSDGGFRKEIVGRFDEVVEYKKLSFEEYKQIAKIFLDKAIEGFEKGNNKKIELKYSEDLVDKIVKDADFDTLGARAIKTSIQHNFINRVSKFIIKNGANNCALNVKPEDVELIKIR